ncbi:mRNA biogenesis factor-domain-containing protein [Rhodocollybia butyracea]|uniref:mRNA biogenesis factor-domain-containing protein n=1 Tax=Rhodocollybia butyracea TaxID=206335 RepID=A0A9P5Q3V0_9AGAR|nr:mRNA biogenesis factor-domain-containing protein [Rhodocollybia butyracea]
MGKNLNPADAYRKAQRKKELKKNKAERSKARDFALVKKDTRDLEDEIEKLEGLAQPSATDKSRLSAATVELEKINVKKEEYVKEHPEQRRLVYRPRRDDGKPTEELILPKKRNYFDKNGLPRHPERSVYYDAVMNPYGVAPPGMPYMERPLLPGEIDSEAEDGDDDDDDIPMPEGPPPKIDEWVNSDDDIPMPDDSVAESQSMFMDFHLLLLSSFLNEGEMPTAASGLHPPLPPGPPPPSSNVLLNSGLPPLPVGMPFPPPPPPFHIGGLPPPPPPPPMGFSPASMPPYMGMPSFPPNLPPPPPLPPGFQSPMGRPPPGFFPRREKSVSAMQDPLSSIPHQTYQAHRASQLAGHPSLPSKPSIGEVSQTLPSAAATVSAAPQLRDLKKEATSFVPSALKRKRGGAASSTSSRVNAAPGIGNEEEDAEASTPARPDLLSTLRNQFGLAPSVAKPEQPAKKAKVETIKKKDDYDRFVEDIGDILNPS